MRGLTHQEAAFIREELTSESGPWSEQLTDEEEVVYNRLIARGLLRAEEHWEDMDDRPGWECPVDYYFVTERGLMLLQIYDSMSVAS